MNLDAVLGASTSIDVVVMGTTDLAKELRVPPDSERLGLLNALSHCITVARAHCLDILDGVHLDFLNSTDFDSICAQGRRLGFDGKTLIHPCQIAEANRAFSPNAAAVNHAEKVLAAWQEAEREGKGMVVVDGRLVENLHLEEAKRLLELHTAISGR
ncbi:CoA ester lyase [Alkalilimnicola ehrlichii]|uniref:HpcH/HpaI aldolase/citrate lyase family protein n=1 Tax=Alkalilimnicola ehrlichii TaxID=351052 RepID=UPI001C6E3570|nr:aldolase/citrate lyase family protein [Alkalilimnicola ehrlichii]